MNCKDNSIFNIICVSVLNSYDNIPYIFDETQCIFSKYYHNNILHYESLKDLTDLNGYDSTKEISIINNNFKINAIIGKMNLDNFNITKKSSILFKEWIKKGNYLDIIIFLSLLLLKIDVRLSNINCKSKYSQLFI